MFRRKESGVKNLIRDHFLSVQECLDAFGSMIHFYLDDNNDFEETSYRVHELENQADEIRRNVEEEIYKGAFMPLFREDYISLVELSDRVANRAETVSDILAQQSPDIPDDMRDDLVELTDRVLECFDPLINIISAMDESWEDAREIAQQVEEMEQKVDEIEWDLITELFEREDLNLSEKLQLRDLIQFIASVSDRMEDTSDRVDIMLVKRKV